MEKSITPIILVFVGMIIVGMLLIPFLLELTEEPDLQMGDRWSYTPETTIDAEISYSGSLLEHSNYSVDGDTISFLFTEEGTFRLTVTAVSHQPYQIAQQEIDISIGEFSQYHDYKPLLLLVPTMFFVAFMMMLIGRRGGGDDGFGDLGGGYSGGDISGRFGRGGFGSR